MLKGVRALAKAEGLLERKTNGSGPGRFRGEPLPIEALGAPWLLMASLGPSAFFQ